MSENKIMRGYTFVEMIIIFVVLLVLIMAAIMAYVDMRAKAHEVNERAIMATVESAVKAYYARHHRWYGLTPDENPFNLLGDSAPPYKECMSPECDGTHWEIGGDGPGPSEPYEQWRFSCPHYKALGGGKFRGNHWRYIIVPQCYDGPEIKPGTFILYTDEGH